MVGVIEFNFTNSSSSPNLQGLQFINQTFSTFTPSRAAVSKIYSVLYNKIKDSFGTLSLTC